MLATNATSLPDDGAWAFEPKLDGWRVLVEVRRGVVTVTTRAGCNITESVPELWGMVNAVDGDTVLDGELIAGQGTPADFYSLAPRLSASRPAAVKRWAARVPLTFAAFDVLDIGGEPVHRDEYRDRRLLLDGLRLASTSWLTVSSFDQPGEAVLAACDRMSLEGVVAKRLDSRYECGRRSRNWIKVKTHTWHNNHAQRRRKTLAEPHAHDSAR